MASKTIDENLDIPIEDNLIQDPNAPVKPRRRTSSRDVGYNRSLTRKPGVFRISKVPGTTMQYRIQEIDANHKQTYRDVTYAEAIKISKSTGVKINQF